MFARRQKETAREIKVDPAGTGTGRSVVQTSWLLWVGMPAWYMVIHTYDLKGLQRSLRTRLQVQKRFRVDMSERKTANAELAPRSRVGTGIFPIFP